MVHVFFVVHVNHNMGPPCEIVVHVFFMVHMNHKNVVHMMTCTLHEPRKCGLCGRCGSCVFKNYCEKHVT